MDKELPIQKLFKVKDKPWIKIYFTLTIILLVGLCVVVVLMFRYMQTMESNIISNGQAISQTDSDVGQNGTAINSLQQDDQTYNQEIQDDINLIH